MRSNLLTGLVIAAAVFFASATAVAQFTLGGTQARVGQSFTMDVSGGFPNSEYVVLVDTDPGPTYFPMANNLQVDLGFSSAFFAFPSQFIDGVGSGSFGLMINEAGGVGMTFYLQALNVDPTDPMMIVPSNQRKAAILPADPSSGTVTPLTLLDDDSVAVPLGFSFPFYGNTYTQVHVNSNGTLSFGAGSTSFFVTESFFLGGPPTIAALWTDLNPQLGGTVEWDTTSTPGSMWSVRFTGIDDNVQGGPNSFEVSLDVNGHILISYGACAVSEAICGITPGGAATPNSVDLSELGWEGHNAPLSVYEDFTGGSGSGMDLDGSGLLFARIGQSGYLLFR